MKKVHLAVFISFFLSLVGAVHADTRKAKTRTAPKTFAKPSARPAGPRPASAPVRTAPRPAPMPVAKTPPAAPLAENPPAENDGLESLDSLDSLDSPSADGAPAAGTDLSGGEDTEIALDLGEDAFNPYVFSRTEAWGFLPIGALILVGLHLIRVPKRKSKRKIDQARRFFRGISGEGTNTSIGTLPPKSEKN